MRGEEMEERRRREAKTAVLIFKLFILANICFILSPVIIVILFIIYR
jgi:hypothetical protein